jgi:hypothetical protein
MVHINISMYLYVCMVYGIYMYVWFALIKYIYVCIYIYIIYIYGTWYILVMADRKQMCWWSCVHGK